MSNEPLARVAADDCDRRRALLARLTATIADETLALGEYQEALDAFERRYREAFAPAFAELDELEARMAERAARLRPDDKGKQRKAAKARLRASGRPASAAGEAGSELLRPAPARARPDDELKALYRTLTKQIHPDLAGEPAERARREALMIRANAAYAAGDRPALADLLAGAAPPPPPGLAETLASLDAQIELARRQQARLADERAAVEASEFARLMRRVEKAQAEGRDLFAKFALELAEARREANKRLKALERRLARREA